MRKSFLLAVAAGMLAATAATAQPVTLPLVQSITPGTDLIQIIPGGQPSSRNVYAPVSMVRGGSSFNGLFAQPLITTNFKNGDGTTLGASTAANKLFLAITAGTSEFLQSETANNNTKTDIASYEVVLPSGYVATSNFNLTANCNYTLGSGTVGTHTLAIAAYSVTSAGVQSANLIATSAQTIPATAGTVQFTVAGATLVPGSRLFFVITLIIQDTGSSNITAQVNSITMS